MPWTPQPGGTASWVSQLIWILSSGLWDDTAPWDDTQAWVDGAMWTNEPDGTAVWEPQ